LPDSFWYNIPKRKKSKWPQNVTNFHKICQMAVKYTKWPYNIPNGRKMYQMAVKYNMHFHYNGPPKYTKLDIFGEKIYVPSGNPDTNAMPRKKSRRSKVRFSIDTTFRFMQIHSFSIQHNALFEISTWCTYIPLLGMQLTTRWHSLLGIDTRAKYCFRYKVLNQTRNRFFQKCRKRLCRPFLPTYFTRFDSKIMVFCRDMPPRKERYFHNS
jgi:hypothetical protein